MFRNQLSSLQEIRSFCSINIKIQDLAFRKWVQILFVCLYLYLYLKSINLRLFGCLITWLLDQFHNKVLIFEYLLKVVLALLWIILLDTFCSGVLRSTDRNSSQWAGSRYVIFQCYNILLPFDQNYRPIIPYIAGF